MIKEVKVPDGMQWANVVDEIESTVEDTGMIVRVGSANDDRWGMSWNDFKRAFWDTEYRLEGGFCALAADLVVVLSDGSWYEQDKTNGHFYHRMAPTKWLGKPFDKIVGQGTSSLWELNADDKANV